MAEEGGAGRSGICGKDGGSVEVSSREASSPASIAGPEGGKLGLVFTTITAVSLAVFTCKMLLKMLHEFDRRKGRSRDRELSRYRAGFA